MAPPNFPLRWESIGDQWWYASPIDWAAANGLYDLVRELLHLDTNLLIKLTSLRRIRRLETVWDDDEGRFSGVAKCRCRVARKLLLACEMKGGHNSLIRAGYGGWLLYTAASAGDVEFVSELLHRDPLLVYGEGEYGVTDLFYAAARGRSSEVFRMLIDFALAPRSGNGGEDEEAELGTAVSGELRWEVVNRAVHAAARGGNSEMLRELLEENGGGVFSFRDDQGCTVLHSASGRGQVQVVKFLIENFDIITSTDNQGNTALHVATYRGYLAVVEVLILASASLITLTNNYGDTFLHMAVAGFRAPGFRRLDKLIELMKHLLCGNIVDVKDVINTRNDDGRTALHMAVSENIHINLVEMLMAVPSIDLNIRDADGMTPLDLLKQHPQSASSEILIKQLISAGGISNCRDHRTRNALVSHLKMHGIGTSPGTSFRIPDAEIFLYTATDNASEASCERTSVQFSTFSGDLSQFEPSNTLTNNKKSKMSGSVNNTAKRLNFFLRWPRRKDKKPARTAFEDNDSLDSLSRHRDFEDCHIPLRQLYTKSLSLPNNRRTYSVDASFPSPSTKMQFTAGLMHGVINTMPHFTTSADSPPSTSALSESSHMSTSPAFGDKHVKKLNVKKPCGSHNQKEKPHNDIMSLTRHESLDEKLMMNEYFCFGAQGLERVEDSLSCSGKHHQSYRNYSSIVA